MLSFSLNIFLYNHEPKLVAVDIGENSARAAEMSPENYTE